MQLRNGKHPHDIDAVTRTIRSQFVSLSGVVSGRVGPNPGTATKLYYRSVLPHALFGCELWNGIKKVGRSTVRSRTSLLSEESTRTPIADKIRHGHRSCRRHVYGGILGSTEAFLLRFTFTNTST